MWTVLRRGQVRKSDYTQDRLRTMRGSSVLAVRVIMVIHTPRLRLLLQYTMVTVGMVYSCDGAGDYDAADAHGDDSGSRSSDGYGDADAGDHGYEYRDDDYWGDVDDDDDGYFDNSVMTMTMLTTMTMLIMLMMMLTTT